MLLLLQDAHRALELLEDYCNRLNSPGDKQLRIAIEKLIFIFKSSLFQALLDIQEFYEAILLDDNTDANAKALAVLRIADKWLENAPLPNGASVSTRSMTVIYKRWFMTAGFFVRFGQSNPNLEYKNGGLMVQVGSGAGGPSPIAGSTAFNAAKKSPSFHSNRSENMSVEDRSRSQSQNKLAIPCYDDHWTYEQITLERVSASGCGE